MKFSVTLFFLLFLCGCQKSPQIEEVDLSQYFGGINGTAVFYHPEKQMYKIYNPALSTKQTSPCSTFKIMSAYLALSEKLISVENSQRDWNKTPYWNPHWHKNMEIAEAFQTSCVWYFRRLIDEAGQTKIQALLNRYNYGNKDISDWTGSLNNNEKNPDLNGFWIESSLKISPLEQTRVLAGIFEESGNQTAADLAKIMQVSNTPVKIYGKTGMGVKNDRIADAWFVGFYEQDGQRIYFALRLDDKENNQVSDYRHKASRIAKQTAITIINNAKLF